MITFKEFIAEVLDTDIEYKIERVTADLFVASATIGEREIVFTASADEWSWEIAFGELKKGSAGKTFKATGSGDELKVGAMVKKALEEFLKRYHPLEIFFSSDDPTRTKIYKRMLDRILTKYTSTKDQFGGKHEVVSYRLKPAKKLSEVADADVPYDTKESSERKFKTLSTINGREVRFIAKRMPLDNISWYVEFEERTKSDYWTVKQTNSGGEFTVASFVVKSLREFIDKYKPEIILFGVMKNESPEDSDSDSDSDSDAREQVYTKLLARKFKDYEVTVRQNTLTDSVSFTMKRKS